MLAAWYERQGAAVEVLEVGEMATPGLGRGEVRVRVRFSGVNHGDTKKRSGWLGFGMAYPRVVPHSDGTGLIDAVGEGVDPTRVGQRVWLYGAQSYRPFGTAAQVAVVPAEQAVELPDEVSDELGACLGIPGITAHRAVFGDGPVARQYDPCPGRARRGRLARRAACALGRRDGDRNGPRDERSRSGRPGRRARRGARSARCRPQAIRADAPEGVDRIIEVAFSDNADLDADVAANDAVIAAYATRRDRPEFPFWPMLFANLTIRLLGSDDFPVAAKRQAAADLTTAAREGASRIPIGDPLPLDRIAEAHDRVDAGARERVLLAIPS